VNIFDEIFTRRKQTQPLTFVGKYPQLINPREQEKSLKDSINSNDFRKKIVNVNEVDSIASARVIKSNKCLVICPK
jgi:hypothetical protein